MFFYFWLFYLSYLLILLSYYPRYLLSYYTILLNLLSYIPSYYLITIPLIILILLVLLIFIIFLFFSIRVFFHRHWQLTHRTAGEGRGPSFIPLYHFHLWLTNIQTFICNSACMWDGYYIFLIAMLVFTRLLLDEIYQLIKFLFDWLMMWYWFSFVCLLIWF